MDGDIFDITLQEKGVKKKGSSLLLTFMWAWKRKKGSPIKRPLVKE